MRYLSVPIKYPVKNVMFVEVDLCQKHIFLGKQLVFFNFGPLYVEPSQHVAAAFNVRPSVTC
ncbi:UNVERIFIED_CONTAM: hypothetical protein NY603_33175, partial [Bacteroidetes bacterium 56_B9]